MNRSGKERKETTVGKKRKNQEGESNNRGEVHAWEGRWRTKEERSGSGIVEGRNNRSGKWHKDSTEDKEGKMDRKRRERDTKERGEERKGTVLA